MPGSSRTRFLDWVVAATSADPPVLRRYGVTLLLCLAAIGLRMATRPFLGDSAPFGLYLPAVVLAAAYGGLATGLLATAVLTLPGLLLFERPFIAATPSVLLRIGFFALNALVVSVLVDILHHARRRVPRLERERRQDEEERSARAVEKSQVQEKALRGLSDVLRIAEVADLLLAQGLSGLGASAGGVALFERGRGQLVLRRSVGYPADRLSALHVDDEGPVADALRMREAVAVGSVAELAARYPRLPQPPSGRESVLVMPLVVQAQPLGVLYFWFSTARRFGEADLALLRTLASHGAPALERAQRYEAERAARLEAEASGARHRLLAEVSALLASRVEPTLTLPDVARRLVPELADACAIHLVELDGATSCIAVAHGVASLRQALLDLCEASRRGAGSPSIARCLRGDEAARLEEVALWGSAAAPGDEADLLRVLGLTGGLSVPLRARGRFLGRVALFTCGTSRPPGVEDLDFAVVLCERIALAVDNALLLSEAQRLNRVKDDFLAMLSHELRTPLGAVLLWTDLLASESLGPGAARAADMIGRSTRSLAQLIEELLDVSRIVAGKLAIDPHPTLLRDLLEQVVEGARPAAQAKG
ncbi:MAG TPA: GAF domain-containing protein, partial [Vicinamibacteria bacterium]|nr:GAF domain-containing protein [Vicinamibacteria bacterium]